MCLFYTPLAPCCLRVSTTHWECINASVEAAVTICDHARGKQNEKDILHTHTHAHSQNAIHIMRKRWARLELIKELTWFYVVRTVAGQQHQVILTLVWVQQRAVVEAEVNNQGHSSLTDHVILLLVRTHAPSSILSRVSSSERMKTPTQTHTHTRSNSPACRR